MPRHRNPEGVDRGRCAAPPGPGWLLRFGVRRFHLRLFTVPRFAGRQISTSRLQFQDKNRRVPEKRNSALPSSVVTSHFPAKVLDQDVYTDQEHPQREDHQNPFNCSHAQQEHQRQRVAEKRHPAW